MHLAIKIKEKRIKLCLVSGKKILSSLKWQENSSLSRDLLGKINQLLQKNRTSIDKISGYKIISDVPKKWTSCRIAQITLKSLMLSRRT